MIAPDQRIFQILSLVLMLLVTTVVDLSAQTTTPSTATAATDTFVTVVQRRSQEEIKADLAYCAAVRSGAQTRKERVKEELHGLEVKIKALEKDIEAIEGRLDTLDSDKDSAAYATAKQRKALLEKFKDLLEVRTDARKAEEDAAQAALGFAESREAMCAHESALLAKNAELENAMKKKSSAAILLPLQQAVKSMEKELQERWEKALSKQDDWVSEEKDFLDALRKLADAQNSFHEE